jgi:transposase InsO family protein
LDEVFISEGMRIIRGPGRAPRVNAYTERWVRTVRGECLDRLLLVSRRHTERALLEYVCRYNQQRPHRGIGLSVPVTTHSSGVSLSPLAWNAETSLGT